MLSNISMLAKYGTLSKVQQENSNLYPKLQVLYLATRHRNFKQTQNAECLHGIARSQL